MKVAIVSDTHFGYGWGSERADDCFENAMDAFQATVDADVVVLPGDIYDKKVPKQEVLSKSIDCFNIYRNGDCTVQTADSSDIQPTFDGTPVVAIHGTHERRSEGFVNPIELLDKMGYLCHLHNDVLVLEKGGEKVAIHGMSGVPERYAPGVLDKFDPEPVKGAYNLFMFHQSVENFVYTSGDHPVLTLEHLPDGFDLLVDGHIHWYDLDLAGEDKPLILPGSTVSTQMRKIEAEKPKGYVTVDTDTGDIEFHALETPRDQYYEELDVDGMSGAEIHGAVDDLMDDILNDTHDKKPLVRIKLTGKTDATIKLAEIRQKYGDDCVLSVSKQLDARTTHSLNNAFQDDEKSIAEQGKAMLRSKMAENGSTLRIDDLFELLAEEEKDTALERVEELELPDEPENKEESSTDASPQEAEEAKDSDESSEHDASVSEESEEDVAASEQQRLQ